MALEPSDNLVRPKASGPSATTGRLFMADRAQVPHRDTTPRDSEAGADAKSEALLPTGPTPPTPPPLGLLHHPI